jgi:Domain of unknown function (DUF4388)
MPLSGTFSTMPFADLLQWLGDTRRSGTLSVMLDFEERLLRFDHGKLAAYGSDDPMARDIGRLCLSRGLCDEPRLLAALESQRHSQMPLADVLMANGTVDPEKLDEAVRAHVEDTVLGLFLWPEGRFDFSELAPQGFEEWMPPEYELAEPIDVRGILMEGMRRLDEWTRIVKILPSDEALVIALGPSEDLPILESIAAHPEPPSLGQLLAEVGDGRFAVCEQLFRAFERGLVAFETGRPRPPAKTSRGTTTVEHLVHAAEALLGEGQHEEAATLLRTAVAMDPFRAESRALVRRCRDAQLTELYTVLPPSSVPRLAMAKERLGAVELMPRERKLLGAVNGRWDVSTLAITSALGELETLRSLRRLVHAGVLQL